MTYVYIDLATNEIKQGQDMPDNAFVLATIEDGKVRDARATFDPAELKDIVQDAVGDVWRYLNRTE